MVVDARAVIELLGIEVASLLPDTLSLDGPRIAGKPDSTIDQLDLGRFQLLGEIGRGGMGRVLEARDPDLRRTVAVKVVIDPAAVSDAQLSRFVAEAQVTSQLQHPGIVPVYEMGVTTDGQIYFVMKRIEGRSMRQLLEDIELGEADDATAWSQHKLLTAFVQICNAVAYAHSLGVVHRDLKPSNIMFGRFGEVLVLDWGLARLLGSGPEELQTDRVERVALARTLDGVAIGTAGYMSPEQARGDVDLLDPRSDVFALGAVLYELLTSRRAYPGASVIEVMMATVRGAPLEPSEVAPDRSIHPEIEEVCMTALSPNPAHRYADAAEMGEAVEAYLEGRARREVERRRRRIVGTVAAAVGLALAVASVFLGSQWRQAEEARRLADAALGETRVRTLVATARDPALAERPGERLALLRAAASEAAVRAGGGIPDELVAALLRHVRPSALVHVLPDPAAGSLLAGRYSPDGALLAVGGGAGRLVLWPVDTGVARVVWDDYGGPVAAVAWSEDGRRLAAGGEGGQIRLVDTTRWTTTSWDSGAAVISDLVFVDDALVAVHGTARSRWDAESGAPLPAADDLTEAQLDRLRRVVEGPEAVLAGISEDEVAVLNDPETGIRLERLGGHASNELLWRPDSSLLGSLGADGAIRLWHTDQGALVAAAPTQGPFAVPAREPVGRGARASLPPMLDGVEPRRADVTAVAAAPDRVAVGWSDGEVRVWQREPVRLVAALPGHDGPVEEVSFAPSGGHLWTAGADGSVLTWDPDRLPPAASLLAHTGTRTNLRVCPSDLRVVPVVPYPPFDSVWAPATACAE